jgi:hypothetical protein
MATVYRKTLKGLAEIDTRAMRLTPRLRGLLILVDGRRSSNELQALLATPLAESLQGLRALDLIEPVPAAAAAPAAAAPAPAATSATSMANLADPEWSGADFVAYRRGAVRVLTDKLGPAAESLALRMERAPNMAALAPLLQMAARLVGSVRGAAAAAAFAEQFPAGPHEGGASRL